MGRGPTWISFGAGGGMCVPPGLAVMLLSSPVTLGR